MAQKRVLWKIILVQEQCREQLDPYNKFKRIENFHTISFQGNKCNYLDSVKFSFLDTVPFKLIKDETISTFWLSASTIIISIVGNRFAFTAKPTYKMNVTNGR